MNLIDHWQFLQIHRRDDGIGVQLLLFNPVVRLFVLSSGFCSELNLPNTLSFPFSYQNDQNCQIIWSSAFSTARLHVAT